MGNARELPVTRTAIGFKSSDGKSQVRGLLWQPETARSPHRAPAVRGIVQLVHGMAEHVGRYDEFARFLAARGFAVCAHDHIGHGKSAPDAETRGHMPARGGKDILVSDVHELRKTIAARYPRQTPYVIFGHSMGSFVTRVYLSRFGEGLSGAVLCGTGNQPRAASAAGNRLSRLVASLKGEAYRSDFLHSLVDGAFSKKIEGARTPLDWLSTDPAVVDAYLADELSGARFSAGAYATLTSLTLEAASLEAAERIPRGLPVLFVAGEGDPVGDFGRGVRSAAELLRRAGVSDVEVSLYPGMRHEILNEPGKQQVYTDVLHWMEAHVEGLGV